MSSGNRERGIAKVGPPSFPHSAFREEVIPVEKRKEYEEGDIIVCPRCGSDDLDCDEAPSHAKCNSCGQEMRTKTVLIWEE
jgi:ribosomal protein S27E